MIQFREKQYSGSEYDAMRYLYVSLCKRFDRNRIKIIDSQQLPSALKGNNIIIERFVINKPPFGVDKYRIYLKIGAKAKMPDQVRLPGRKFINDFGKINVRFKSGWSSGAAQTHDSNATFDPSTDTLFSETTGETRIKLFADKKKNGNGGGGGDGGAFNFEFTPFISSKYESQQLTAEVLLFDKKTRTLVLEAKDVDEIINALNILPFGLNYNILLLDA